VRTVGVEFEGNLRPTRFFNLSATLTYQDPKFKNYIYNTLVSGKLVSTSFNNLRPSSMPKLWGSLRPELSLFHDRVRILGEWRYEGDKFNDDADTVKLPAYSVFNASVQVDVTKRLTLALKGDNLSNALGLGQGGSAQSVPAASNGNVILARPIFGRNISGSVLFKF